MVYGLIDDYTREHLTLKMACRLRSQDALEQLGYRFICRRLPGSFRSDNEPESTAKSVRYYFESIRCSNPFYRTRKSLGEQIQ